MIKRYLGAAALAAVLVGLMLPGTAFASHLTIEFRSPTPANGAVISGASNGILVHFSTTALSGSTGLKKVTLRISPVSPSGIPALGAGSYTEWENQDITAPFEKDLSLGWNTLSLTPYNGVYRVEATAQGNNPLNTDVERSSRDIKVNNGTAAPAGVSAGFVSDDEWFDGSDSVKVNWSRNNEAPDHQTYALYKSINGGAYFHVKTANVTSHTDSALAENASYRYQVIAYRYSPVSDLIASGPTTSAAVSTPAVKPPPPPPPDSDPSPSPSPSSGTKTSGGSPPGLTLQS
ncbi:MAG: hypothetical protein ACRDIA_03215, partial [Actinomycetota bacterium]